MRRGRVDTHKQQADYYFRCNLNMTAAMRRICAENERLRTQLRGYQETEAWALALVGATPRREDA